MRAEKSETVNVACIDPAKTALSLVHVNDIRDV